MIYDYSILTSFLFTSLLIFVLVYAIYHIKNRVHPQNSAKKSEDQALNKQVAFDFNLLSILLLILICIRVFFLIIFPIELQKQSISDYLFSLRFNFIVVQGIAVSFYVYYFFKIKLIKQIADKYKNSLSLRILSTGLFLSTAELLVSFFYYTFLNYQLILPELTKYSFGNVNLMDSNLMVTMAIFCIAFLVLFMISYFLLQRKKNIMNIVIFMLFHSLVMISAVFLTLNQLTFYFDENFLNYSAIELLDYRTGFIGWIWLGILVIGIGGQLFNLTVIRLRKKFANQQVAANYSMQLVKINILSTVIICTISLLPFIFSAVTFIME